MTISLPRGCLWGPCSSCLCCARHPSGSCRRQPVAYSEPENVGAYEYQSVAEPMGAMGTNTAFMGTHDGVPPSAVQQLHRAAVFT